MGLTEVFVKLAEKLSDVRGMELAQDVVGVGRSPTPDELPDRFGE